MHYQRAFIFRYCYAYDSTEVQVVKSCVVVKNPWELDPAMQQ